MAAWSQNGKVIEIVPLVMGRHRARESEGKL